MNDSPLPQRMPRAAENRGIIPNNRPSAASLDEPASADIDPTEHDWHKWHVHDLRPKAEPAEMGIWVFAAFIGDSQLFPIAAFRFDEERLRLPQRRGAAFRGGVSGWTWKYCRNSFFSCIG